MSDMNQAAAGYVVELRDGHRRFVAQLHAFSDGVPILCDGRQVTVFASRVDAEREIGKTKRYVKKHNLGWAFKYRVLPLVKYEQ